MPSTPSEFARSAGAKAALPAWLAACRLRLSAPPLTAREALLLDGKPVGSLHPGVRADSAAFWPPRAGATEALAHWAAHLRASGRCGPWRGELLSVREGCDLTSEPLAAVERGAARVLGIRTHAAHLVGFTGDGRVWLQQRAFNKPNDPGLWDTLVGGLVAHGETLADALQRETREEAGLRLDDLGGLRHRGSFDVSKPSGDGGDGKDGSAEGGLGHMWETIHWFTAQVPEGVDPVNQDGEVERFEALDPDAVGVRVVAGECTDEAAWVLALALGWPLPLSDS